MNSRIPGALCQELSAWVVDIKDGTMARALSPVPGAVGGDGSHIGRILAAASGATKPGPPQVMLKVAQLAASIPQAAKGKALDIAASAVTAADVLKTKLPHQVGDILNNPLSGAAFQAASMVNEAAAIQKAIKKRG